jgi:hypothetical protein
MEGIDMDSRTRNRNRQRTALVILTTVSLLAIAAFGAIKQAGTNSPLVGKHARVRNPWGAGYQVAFNDVADVQGFLDAEQRATSRNQRTLLPDDAQSMADKHRRKVASYFPFDSEVQIIRADGKNALIKSANPAQDYLEGWVPVDWLAFPKRIN